MTNPDDRAAIEAMADAFVGKLTDSDAEAGIWATAALAALRDAGWSVTPPAAAENWHDNVDPTVCHCGRDAECHWKHCPAKDGKCPLPWPPEPRDV